MREHTAAINPPRALWVPFVLGRPFGVPGDAAFQRRVLYAALRLLEAASGPVLEAFEEDAPGSQPEDGETFVCPVSFNSVTPHDDAAALQQEIADLMPWHDLARRRRGRSTAALSGLGAERAGRFITDFIANPNLPSYRVDLSMGLALRLACEDLKSFYLESVNAQPGAVSAQQAQQWFWRETTAGRVFRRLREVCLNCRDETVQAFGSNNLVPRAILHALEEPGGSSLSGT